MSNYPEKHCLKKEQKNTHTEKEDVLANMKNDVSQLKKDWHLLAKAILVTAGQSGSRIFTVSNSCSVFLHDFLWRTKKLVFGRQNNGGTNVSGFIRWENNEQPIQRVFAPNERHSLSSQIHSYYMQFYIFSSYRQTKTHKKTRLIVLCSTRIKLKFF